MGKKKINRNRNRIRNYKVNEGTLNNEESNIRLLLKVTIGNGFWNLCSGSMIKERKKEVMCKDDGEFFLFYFFFFLI